MAAALANGPTLRDLETLIFPANVIGSLQRALRRTLPHTATVLPQEVDYAEEAMLGEALSRNHYIQSLTVLTTSDIILDTKIIPALVPRWQPQRFAYLTSLYLHWEGPGMKYRRRSRVPEDQVMSIAEYSLRALGKLTSLKQLCLIGGYYPNNSQWLVHHGMLRSCFAPLKQLKRLAICGDTYEAYGHASIWYYSWAHYGYREKRDARRRPDLDACDDGGYETESDHGLWAPRPNHDWDQGQDINDD